MYKYMYKDLTCEFYQKHGFRTSSHFESLYMTLVWYLVQRNKPVKFAFDLIVFFEYYIIENIHIPRMILSF